MSKIQFRKEYLSIQGIGKQRFWIGIFAGLFFAISLSLFINYLREGYRFITCISADLVVPDKYEFIFFKYFFSTLSTVLGLSIAIWTWMNNRNHKRNIDRQYKQLSKTYILLILGTTLIMVGRFSNIIALLVFIREGYENDINLHSEYWYLFIIIILVIFSQSWFTIRLVYRIEKWVVFSIILCIIVSMTIAEITTIKNDKPANIYFQRFEKDYQYITQETFEVKTKYGIEYSEKTIDILKKWKTNSSCEQVESLKSAFSRDCKVSLDTIILQKIVVHNVKQGAWFYSRQSDSWQYALPRDILKQISYFRKDANETKELFEVLREEIELVNTPEIDWNEYEKFTETERRRSNKAKYEISPIIIKQLRTVIEILKQDKGYAEMTKNL